MKILVTIFLFSISLSYSQTWQTIEGNQFNFPVPILCNGSKIKQVFKINPYNNTVWMLNTWGNEHSVRTFDEFGQFYEYNAVNEPVFINWAVFEDIAFTPSYTFVANYTGLFSFDGASWLQESAANKPIFLTAYEDTVWMPRLNLDYLKWADGTPSLGNTSTIRRMAVKNDLIWISPGETDVIGFYNEGGSIAFHSPDTSKLMSWNNYDFKFTRNSDSLYSSSELGISIAYNGFFVDSITPANTTNMPTGSIIEFEFDQDDNLWAVFAPDNAQNTASSAIAYLDRSINQWTEIIDANNSPIPFNSRVTIELDTADNLWVCNNANIYIRKVNNWPGWLDVEELSNDDFAISPNPSNGTFTITFDKNLPESFTIFNSKGQEVLAKSVVLNKINLSTSKWKPGVYYIKAVYLKTSVVKKLIVY